MNCRKIKLTEKYLFGELTDKKLRNIEKHICNCSVCQDWISFNKKLNGLHKYVKEYKAPGFFTERILANLPSPGTETTLATPLQRFITHPVWRFATITAVIFLALLTWILKHPRSVTVKIELYLPAQTVSLVGDFNNWDINATKLVKHNSKWVTKLSLKPGRYQYTFIIDGEKWLPDPNAVEYVNDGFGNKNSILDTTYIEPQRSKV